MNELPETRQSLLLRLATPSDQAAWSDFVELYEPIIIRMAMRRGLQHTDALDLSQEVLSRVAKSIGQWNHDPARGTFRGWLAQVTRNLTVDHFRRLSRNPLPLSDNDAEANVIDGKGEDPDRLFEVEERRQLFFRAGNRARQHFSENTWQAFWLTSVEMRTPQQAAENLGISVGAVYIARSRVLAKIRELVQMDQSETQSWSTRHES